MAATTASAPVAVWPSTPRPTVRSPPHPSTGSGGPRRRRHRRQLHRQRPLQARPRHPGQELSRHRPQQHPRRRRQPHRPRLRRNPHPHPHLHPSLYDRQIRRRRRCAPRSRPARMNARRSCDRRHRAGELDTGRDGSLPAVRLGAARGAELVFALRRGRADPFGGAAEMEGACDWLRDDRRGLLGRARRGVGAARRMIDR